MSPFLFGGELNGKQANCDENFPHERGKGPDLGRPSVVGSVGANPFGLCNQHGQVWEWCQDWYEADNVSASSQADPTGASLGSSRVLRGGSWLYAADNCRSAARDGNEPSERDYSIGFRMLCELS